MAGLGGGSSDSAFGAHTANVLQKFTGWFVLVFFVLVISLSHTLKDEGPTDSVIDTFKAPQTNQAAPAPAPAPQQAAPTQAPTPVTPAPSTPAPKTAVPALPTTAPEPSQAPAAPTTVPSPVPADPTPKTP